MNQFCLFCEMIVHVPIQLTLANKLYLSSRIDVENMFLSKRNKFGLVLFFAINKFDQDRDPARDAKVDMSPYTECVTLRVTESIYLKKGVYLSNQAIKDFNLFVKNEMLDDFHAYMDFHFRLNRSQLRQCIYDWMHRSKLHEDAIAMRTLEKDYERYRKSKEVWCYA